MRWHRKGLTPAPGEDKRLTKEKIAWAKESLCLKWWVVLRAGVNQYPSHLTTLDGWKRWPSRSIGAIERGDLWLGVRQWMSSAFWDREGHAYAPALRSDRVKQSLQFADVASVGQGGYCDRKIVDGREHKPFGDRHVQGGNIYQEKQGGDWGPLGGAHQDRRGEVGGSLKH